MAKMYGILAIAGWIALVLFLAVLAFVSARKARTSETDQKQ